MLKQQERTRNIIAIGNRPCTAIQNANLADIGTYQSTAYQYHEELCLPQGIQTCPNNYPSIIYDNIHGAHTVPVGGDLYQQSYYSASYQGYQSTPSKKNQNNGNSEDSTDDTQSPSNSHPHRVASLDQESTQQHINYRPTRLLDFFVKVIPE